jgi:RNA polymerase sigma factor (sigma-70 family)
MDALPERYRAPLVLRYFAEQSYTEIAEALALSEAQVGMLLYRARRKLRDILCEGMRP